MHHFEQAFATLILNLASLILLETDQIRPKHAEIRRPIYFRHFDFYPSKHYFDSLVLDRRSNSSILF